MYEHVRLLASGSPSVCLLVNLAEVPVITERVLRVS
jgi:hypothetical protein